MCRPCAKPTARREDKMRIEERPLTFRESLSMIPYILRMLWPLLVVLGAVVVMAIVFAKAGGK